MRGATLAAALALCCGPLCPAARCDDGGDPLEDARRRWADGEIEAAAESALRLGAPLPPEARSILARADFVRGRYREAIAHAAALPEGGPARRVLAPLVIAAHEHLDQYAEAAAFAEREKISYGWGTRRKQRPTTASLRGITTIPFADVPLSAILPGEKGSLSDFLPHFDVEIEGKPLQAAFDTGGPFLVMHPDMAKKLGIPVEKGGLGHLAGQVVQTEYGLARRMRLGDSVIENVPVITAPSVGGVIFGTNILERFLATVDYPGRRLILSPRGDAELSRKHLALLPQQRTEAPFYLWDDHYMFARGGIGDRKGLNFFIDSGLVALLYRPGLRQAAFTASFDTFLGYGYAAQEISQQGFESRCPLSLGPLSQEGHLLYCGGKPGDGRPDPAKGFGGVRIDGLLSHAFLKRYAWTIDFDRRVYVFSEPAPEKRMDGKR